MLHASSQRSGHGPVSITKFVEKESTPRKAMNEVELAARWHISVKTLQRWRIEGGGPEYLKLNRRVSYTQEAIEAFEKRISHVTTTHPVAPRGVR